MKEERPEGRFGGGHTVCVTLHCRATADRDCVRRLMQREKRQ